MKPLPWAQYSGDKKLAYAAFEQALKQEATPQFPGVDMDAIHKRDEQRNPAA
jgi:hypothetical protein